MKNIPYCELGFFPTPLHKLNNISEEYPDYNLFIKRDDQTGLAFGGNKTRKLEYLFKDAVDTGYDTVITIGAPQSNHCRQTAAGAAQLGLECRLLLRGTKPKISTGNLLLNKMLGAEVHWFDRDELEESQNKLISELKSKGKKPYLIPVGGSNEIGTLGYVRAMDELKKQLNEQKLNIDYIVFASCSGGTHAGMILGKEIYNLETEIIGISIEKDLYPDKTLKKHISDIGNKAYNILNIKKNIAEEDVILIEGYNEAGYSIVTEQETTAISKLAKTEGIFLDPVYTGRAYAGLSDMMKKSYFEKGSNILFWHTGGGPANFHYGEQLL